jgi:hypothetical protein
MRPAAARRGEQVVLGLLASARRGADPARIGGWHEAGREL